MNAKHEHRLLDSLFLGSLLLIACGVTATAEEGGARGQCGPPPPAKPQRQSGGESAKPPSNSISKLPCAPTRRTEKKMPPAPPTLVAKLSYGENQDWTTDRNDIFNLLKMLGEQYQTPFRAVVVEFGSYTFNPQETPIAYMSGHNPFKLETDQRRELRTFLEAGGTLIIDSCCGSEKFGSAAKEEMKKMFPDRHFKRLPLDHPVFSSHYEVKQVSYTPQVKDNVTSEPCLEGVDFGCRTAVFFSRYDLSCGWDNHTHPHCRGVVEADAIKLGFNMLSYALVNRRQGDALADTRGYTDAAEPTRSKVVLAQVRYRGEWNRHAAATANLLADLDKNFPAEVQYGRTDLELSDPKIFSHPAIYLSGQDDFSLTEEEVVQLRKYLDAGGTLLAESCCGRQEFDQAFRREIARVMPSGKLASLPIEHPVYKIAHDLTALRLPEPLKSRHPGLSVPLLEGIEGKGATAVFYSRYGLSCGWAEEECRYCLGYDAKAAVPIGVNVLGYALSH
ncbi:MAG: DUF4159 domain-containing protein [Planctomycetes bacterium]|nr:DUF4159 domain-containing protein [Planctomycetota bacterium]